MNIRKALPAEIPAVLEIINESAAAYRGVIDADCWKEPYMPEGELRGDIAEGVTFWCAEEADRILGVMGLQGVEDVSLIRHSYVRTRERGRGIGRALLLRLLKETECPVLAGTWARAEWAVRFYESNGFTLLSRDEGSLLLRRYWRISDRQTAASVVLGDARWCTDRGCGRN